MDSMDMNLGGGEGQGSLVCSSPWGCEESDTTWRMNNNHWIIPWMNNSIPEKGVEKAMATHSSTLAFKIPWMEETGGLQSVGSQRVRHD